MAGNKIIFQTRLNPRQWAYINQFDPIGRVIERPDGVRTMRGIPPRMDGFVWSGLYNGADEHAVVGQRLACRNGVHIYRFWTLNPKRLAVLKSIA